MSDIHEIFRALSDPTRLAIFQLLRCCVDGVTMDDEGRCFLGPSVGEVCCQVGVAQSTVSHHLKELRLAGLIRMERRGRTIYCSVVPETLERIRTFAGPDGAQQTRLSNLSI